MPRSKKKGLSSQLNRRISCLRPHFPILLLSRSFRVILRSSLATRCHWLLSVSISDSFLVSVPVSVFLALPLSLHVSPLVSVSVSLCLPFSLCHCIFFISFFGQRTRRGRSPVEHRRNLCVRPSVRPSFCPHPPLGPRRPTEPSHRLAQTSLSLGQAPLSLDPGLTEPGLGLRQPGLDLI